MRKVIRIDEPKEESKTPIQLKKLYNNEIPYTTHEDYEKIVYLGKCRVDGDLFACYDNDNTIEIFKGELNDGVY